MNVELTQMKAVLERLYNSYNRFVKIVPDPLQFVYQYGSNEDQEIAGFLSAVLAYGRVKQIERSLVDLLARLGSSPTSFIRQLKNSDQKHLSSFKHRFNTGLDVFYVLMAMKQFLKNHGSLEGAFLAGYEDLQPNVIPAMVSFRHRLLSQIESCHRSPGVLYLLADPQKGSPCKRLNLFLRWMVRDDDVDAGLWTHVDPGKLVVPMDVHMSRLCRIIGFHNKKQASMDTALQVTSRFAEICPEDPVKYDFALSRVGIIEQCKGEVCTYCQICELRTVCSVGLTRGLVKNNNSV